MSSKAAVVLASLAAGAIAVKPIHSHNDYTRDKPLFTALDNGIQSVEADIWWRDNKLLVAHTVFDIDSSKTLDSLYIQPILAIVNGSMESTTPLSKDSPLQLLIDFKTDGDDTYQPLLDALEPLRSGGYLTTFKDGSLTQGAVTVVGTGNTPLESVVAAEPRDFFYDANILTLYSTKPADGKEWGPEIAPLASCQWSKVDGDDQMQELVKGAHDLKIKTRFWDTDSNEETWNKFWDAGSDWVNADDLEAISKAWEARNA
ncbi:uncharacterized protein SCHCODRAFT_02611921 [Schizophyllum commune H4-8]|uniref:uncharacterized protein n=1 Tax=Schizophyllum commune (strain H4-8 / FGSC 9210) TaxID=578458 RepID=UPI002160D2FF|nr:uncharacterized protein SCHCODRAFT_02611921 [Schizophyllum commune H4-8]KAI5898382.1 hypothetical protein SCHCODRAFT_02611921 [Schizophyllum commune H4-8]